MRICLASIHPRRLSGQIESLVALARELQALGHQTTVVSAFEDLLFERTGEPRPQGERGTLIGNSGRMLRTVRHIAAVGQKADLLHLNLPTPAFSWLADLLQLRLGRPLVVGYEAHLADAWQLVRSYLRHDPRFYLPRILINNGLWGRLALYRCQRYVVASRYQVAELQALGVDEARLRSLPNLIDRAKLQGGRLPTPNPRSLTPDPRPLTPDPQPLTPDLRPPTPDPRPLIGWVGHYHHVKGVDVLLEAFGRLLGPYPAARLALAWSGIGDSRPVESRIEALGLSERVSRLGRIDVGELFSRLDVLALPYRLTIGQNAFPNLVLEAMQVGVPLVTSDLPLLRELVKDGRTALLARPDEPESLRAALERLLRTPELGRAFVAEQRALMSGVLDPVRVAKRYVELYREVIAEQAGVLQPARRSSRV